MLAGIALLGIVTATFATWFLERVEALTAAEKRADVTLEHVLVEVRELRTELQEVRAAMQPDSHKRLLE